MKMYFSAISVARGLTVLVMPAIHTVMMYSKPEVYDTWWAYVLRFFAEGPGAQLFMFIMGFFLATGKTKSTRELLTRSFSLFAAGYVLNFFRTYLPASLHLFPQDMLVYYGAGTGPHPYLPFLLTGDILQFAGISYGVTGWVAKQRKRCLYAAIIYTLVVVGAPFIWNTRSEFLLVDHLLALVCASDHRAFFPLFPWLCYPMAGLITGIAFNHSNKRCFFTKMGIVGLVLLVLGGVVLCFTATDWNADFYRSSPARTIAYTGFTLLWLSLIYKVILHTPEHHPIIKLLSFCSRHITMIYCSHWIIICWCLPLSGYHQLGKWQTLLTIWVISTFSFGLAFLLSKIKTVPSLSQA